MKLIYRNKIIIFLFLLLTSAQFIFSQNKNSQINDRKILSVIKKTDRSEFRYIPKKPGHYTAQDWRRVIDSTWGEGLSTAKKLQIFDRFWNDINAKYPSFFNIDVNWDSLKTVYRPEIEAGVSRGRFAAIMCKMNFALSDIHSFIIDLPVATDSLKSGTPIFVTSGRQSSIDNEFLYREYCHFGATLSPLPDSSLLVIDVIPEHPMGLGIGDIVLGYDGIPWQSLITEIFNADLPLYFIGTVGNSKQAREFQLLTSAGENWHLFDTIDIIKKSGDTLHLPTKLMQNKKMKLLSTYQLSVPGIEFPSFDNRKYVSWGVIEGTNIGYIYIWNWTHNGDFPYPTTSTGQEFKKAINTLISTYNISSLIIDSRYNTGGWTDEIPIGLNILFNENKDIFCAYYRNLTNDKYSMKPFDWAPQYDLSLEPDRYLFDKPIALLISPLSESCGDMMPFLMRYHPMVKTFGLGTCGAFGITADDANVSDISGDWMYHRTLTDLKITNDTTRYLNHLNFTSGEEVWFTQESVARGEDDVVNAALKWMNNLVFGHDITKNTGYCIPGIDTLKISALVENPNSHQTSAKVYIKNLEGSFIDSLELTKTGLIDSSETWSGSYAAPDSENIFTLSLSATDISESKTWTTDNLSRFTTIGPLTVDSISYKNYSSSGLLAIKAFIRNGNKTNTIKNVTVKIATVDSFLYGQQGELNIPNILPDTTVGTLKWLSINYDQSNFPNYLNLKFEIKSDGWTYWTDSMRVTISPTVAINEQVNQPLTFNLAQNYPNPFNPSTTINYSIPKQSYVTLKVFDILGREVIILVNEEKPAGYYEVEFSPVSGIRNLASGIYFYQIKAGDYTAIKKMILLK